MKDLNNTLYAKKKKRSTRHRHHVQLNAATMRHRDAYGINVYIKPGRSLLGTNGVCKKVLAKST